MKRNKTKLIAALLSLTLLFSTLAMPASAEISTWATHTTDTYKEADGGTVLLWFIKETLESQSMEGPANAANIRATVSSKGVAEGSRYNYTGFTWCDDIDTWTYAGLSQDESSTIYWYNEKGYNAWIGAMKSGEISINWSNGYVTAYPGTASAKVIRPDGKGTEGGTGFSLGLGDDLIIGRGKTALLLAGGAAAFIAAAVIYSDPTILDSAKQKVQEFFVGVADNVTGTVQGWFAPDAPAEEAAASSAVEQPEISG